MTADEEQGAAAEDALAEFQLSLTGEGISVKRTISEGMASEIISVVMGGAAPTGRMIGTSYPARRSRGSDEKSIREYLDEAEAKKIPQIITVIGQYLTDRGQERFSRQDVKAMFPKAGEATPANFTRDFGLAVTSSWVAEDERNEFFVTEPGRRAIEAKFSDQKIRGRRRRPTKKTTAKRAKEA